MWGDIEMIGRVAVVGALLVLAGCANLDTVGRRTSLPDTGGKAIHLDAQQRLVVYNGKKFCAEPSPDALQAYAASLGLGVSVPTQGAGSLAGAQQSNAGSIGLRTQTITVMRDALYRMCEAYNNGVLGDVMVATLLGRSQDLTAVILAVEQLTGAVAADQVILTGSANASASASLISSQQLLDAAQKNEEAKQKAVDEATRERDNAKTALDTAKTAEAQKKTAYDNLHAGDADDSNPETSAAKTEWLNAQDDTKAAEGTLTQAEDKLKSREEQLADAKQVRETVQSAKDAALTDAAAGTGGSGQFSPVVQRKQLSDAASKEIASAVQTMVTAVLEKSYAVESCMALLTSRNVVASRDKPLTKVEELCIRLVERGIEAEISKLTLSYAPDDATACLRKHMESDATFRRRLKDWIEKEKQLRVSVGGFVDNGEYASLRADAVRHFGLSC